MTTLYLFRHGETDMNRERRWQGKSVDSLLNETGRLQAADLGRQLQNAGLDVIYSSPLKRALETAQIIGRMLSVPVVADERLIEGSLGDAEGLTFSEIVVKFAAESAAWHNLDDAFLDARFPNGDSKREMQTRMVAALTDLASRHRGGVVGIAAHSAVLRYFLLSFEIRMPQIPHDRPIRVFFENGAFSL